MALFLTGPNSCAPAIGSSRLCTLFMRRARVLRNAVVLKPSTLLHFHSVLRKRKYLALFASQRGRRPWPEGTEHRPHRRRRRNETPQSELGLSPHRPADREGFRRRPSWLTFIGHMKNSLWSCDLFRCESATLRTHWVLVVMDQFTRRVIGFSVRSGIVDGMSLCRMCQRAIRGHGPA